MDLQSELGIKYRRVYLLFIMLADGSRAEIGSNLLWQKKLLLQRKWILERILDCLNWLELLHCVNKRSCLASGEEAH